MTTEDKAQEREGLRVITGGKSEVSEPEGRRGTTRSPKTASGLTQRQEDFVMALADGCTNTEAYERAFTTEGYKRNILHSKACSLAARPDIKARLSEVLTQRKVERQHVDAQTSERLSERVWRGIWKVAEAPDTPPAARVAALQLAAKAAGMLTDRVETRHLNDPVDIERELQEKLKKYAGSK